MARAVISLRCSRGGVLCALNTDGQAASVPAGGRLLIASGDGVRITQPVEANAVFAVIPPSVAAALQEQWHFYVWNERTGEVRWMCSWDTTEEDVQTFAAAVRDAVA